MIIQNNKQALEHLVSAVSIWERYKKDSTVAENSPIAFNAMNDVHKYLFNHYHSTSCSNCFKNLMKIVMTWYDQNKDKVEEAPASVEQFTGIAHQEKSVSDLKVLCMQKGIKIPRNATKNVLLKLLNANAS